MREAIDKNSEQIVSLLRALARMDGANSGPGSCPAQGEALRNQIRGELQAKILFRPRVELVEPGSLPAGEGKAVRVVDEREK